MISVLASSAIAHEFESRSGQTKDYKIGIVASPLSTQHYGERAKKYTLSQYDSSPSLTACQILVILIDSFSVEQVEEYTCLNTDSFEILVSNIK
jgi:hypothetical protein